MKTVLHKADTRGHANHGWLEAYHSFSFARYYDPQRIHFGMLRVLNDDTISPGRGFGEHPHDNMEIITIPLEGKLEHADSMGNVAVVSEGDVQVMSAGSGITHSEYNKNNDKPLKLLQIWVFSNERNVEPRYDQISIRDVKVKNDFYQILSPYKEDQGVWIHQDAWFSLGDFEPGKSASYKLHKEENGIYLFVIEGSVTVGGQLLERRDALGIWETDSITLASSAESRVLLMEVPMR